MNKNSGGCTVTDYSRNRSDLIPPDLTVAKKDAPFSHHRFARANNADQPCRIGSHHHVTMHARLV